MRLGNLRANTILPWTFLTITVFYILHSSNLLLRQDTNTELSSTTTTTSSSSSLSSSENISTEENLRTTMALCNITSVLKELEEEEEDEQVAADASSVVCGRSQNYETELRHIVFGIAASANLWQKRKEYIKLWWRPKQMRGVVWLERKVNLSVYNPCKINIQYKSSFFLTKRNMTRGD